MSTTIWMSNGNSYTIPGDQQDVVKTIYEYQEDGWFDLSRFRGGEVAVTIQVSQICTVEKS